MRAPGSASSKVQIAVLVDVDLDIVTDLPAPEPIRICIPEPVDERYRVILDFYPHLLGFGVDDLGSFKQVEAALEREEGLRENLRHDVWRAAKVGGWAALRSLTRSIRIGGELGDEAGAALLAAKRRFGLDE